jgi:hypothetical protein
MRRTPLVAAIALTSVFSMTTAYATPPTGEIQYTDLARAQVVENAKVPITGGSTLVRGAYSIAPGGETGWRRLPGTMVLAISKGKLTLLGGEGCAAKDYALGKAAVVPAGVYQVRNAGSEPLEFFGVFFGGATGAPKPLTEGPTEAAPANCSGVMAAGATPSGVSLADSAAAAFVPAFYNRHATLDIPAGRDMYATHYDVSPGWSSGWFAHHQAVNIMEAGTLTYVEAKDGKCDESEVYHAGDAFYHPTHRHIAANYGKDHVLLTTIYFDIPHESPLVPGPTGNQLQAADFSQAPPADCPRLR